MKQPLLKLACSAFLGMALAGSALTGSAQAQTAGSLAVPLAAPAAETSVTADPINHRHWRRYHHRDYRHGGGIYFDFGNGGMTLGVTPRYSYPRYRRHYGYPRVSRSRHVEWCYARYRSYRHWDNTFQPYHGPRKQCVSPYY